MGLHRRGILIEQEVLDIAAQKYYRAALTLVVVPGIVEIVMTSQSTMYKTDFHGSEAYAAVEKLTALFVTKAPYTGNRRLARPHVVIPAPDEAARQAYGGQVIEG